MFTYCELFNRLLPVSGTEGTSALARKIPMAVTLSDLKNGVYGN